MITIINIAEISIKKSSKFEFNLKNFFALKQKRQYF